MYLTMNNWRHEHIEGNKLKVEHPGGSWVGLRLKTANVLALNLHYGFHQHAITALGPAGSPVPTDWQNLRCPGGTGSPGTTPRLADTCNSTHLTTQRI